MSGSRPASHAGSWYTDDREDLDKELNGYLARVPDSIDGVGTIPPDGSRVIIAPHAGYSYSGPAAAWAYKSLNLKEIKRVFILGPSHHVYLDGCALTGHATYDTPLGTLPIDTTTTAALQATGKFSRMSPTTDSDEHSIEMHLPYTYKTLINHFGSPAAIPPVVPILIGSISTSKEKDFGSLLAEYLDSPENAFIVSSDFCHWGSRFSYQYYTATDDPTASAPLSLGKYTKVPAGSQPIWKSIEGLDKRAMDAIETGSHDSFAAYLKETKNTVCGRHPIGVVMAGLEEVVRRRKAAGGAVEDSVGKFRFVRYEQSSKCVDAKDSSVSYASAFAVL
ncbi:hypothetical protein H072_3822 [Dactylellina haptotyla CBS 200.50]|uniref:MEMO1 family protein n=1 Tax=Dactylellina haptotyla (strain CBS 200.50) TaxID=1284197 RepID=S8C3B6_DACHA|nr:hypothetical protein H072_3822 [Dactylellina haptotyla CBS 200.50]